MPPKHLSPTPVYSSNIEIYTEAESAGLTPRTPFGRPVASEHSENSPLSVPDDDEDEGMDEIDMLQNQHKPLLQSSDSDIFPFRSRHGTERMRQNMEKSGQSSNRLWKWMKETSSRNRLPVGLLLGSGTAILLLLLIVASVKRNDALLEYLGVNTTAIAYEALDEESKARFNTSTVIDYAAQGYTSFPLTESQYISQCNQMINDPRMKYWVKYWDTRPGAEMDVLHIESTSTPKTCNSSITYLLDGSVGLMMDLTHLAQVAGFARERNRTLFVYDDNWNRGRWTDHFLPFSATQPGPEPGCAPPPPEELVACPRTARHWVTSARINYFHLGHAFEDNYEDPYKYTIERKRPLYDVSAESFLKSIRPNAINQRLIMLARDELTQIAKLNAIDGHVQYISTQIRRGDREAMSWRYTHLPHRHVPTNDYVDAVWKTYSQLYDLSNPDIIQMSLPVIYLASDSPSAARDFANLLRSNDTLSKKYKNDNLRPVVYELRNSSNFELRSIAPAREYVQADWMENRTQSERIAETRGMIVDWALLSGAWQPEPSVNDATNADDTSASLKPLAAICTLPSSICKAIVFGLGWEPSFDWQEDGVGPHPRWVEIDNHGNIAPIWRPFERFI